MTHRLLPTFTPFRGTRAFTRRDLFGWLARGAVASCAAPSLLELLCRQALAQQAGGVARRKHLVLLWLEGGPSQIDTFDPKPGAATNGPFAALPTDVRGWSMSEHLPELAKRAGKLAVIRTMTSKEGSHARARQLLHAGYTPNPSVTFPTLGSIVAHEIGDLDHDLPAFVQVAGPPGSPGYLGTPCAPFLIQNAAARVENLAAPRGIGKPRIALREALLQTLDEQLASEGAVDEVALGTEQRRRARRLMETKLRSAFDLDEEKDAVRDRYGRSSFGQGVLLARRLLEQGVSAIEVHSEGWDTHIDNFTKTRALCQELDPAFAALIDELEQRGLLADTLIVCMGEFGRTPAIKNYDGRDHWPNNYCVALAGCGVKAGTVLGTTDERGENIVERPVQVADLFGTIATLLGIERDKTFQATARRPVKLIDPDGVVVHELIA